MILGVVLAGGQSSRFGSDKAQELWQGVPLIDHVRRRLACVSTKVLVSGRHSEDQSHLLDRPGPGLGPLGGLAAALHHAAAHGFERVISAPCDTPLLEDELLRALASVDGDAYLAGMPVIGSWRACHSARLDAHLLQSGSRSVRNWAEVIGAHALDLPAPPNINRPSDLKALGN
jgi:molybdopterin-guanine dinucleotide biosynthesis protein A